MCVYTLVVILRRQRHASQPHARVHILLRLLLFLLLFPLSIVPCAGRFLWRNHALPIKLPFSLCQQASVLGVSPVFLRQTLMAVQFGRSLRAQLSDRQHFQARNVIRLARTVSTFDGSRALVTVFSTVRLKVIRVTHAI